jgi:hypothetical protein
LGYVGREPKIGDMLGPLIFFGFLAASGFVATKKPAAPEWYRSQYVLFGAV